MSNAVLLWSSFVTTVPSTRRPSNHMCAPSAWLAEPWMTSTGWCLLHPMLSVHVPVCVYYQNWLRHALLCQVCNGAKAAAWLGTAIQGMLN